MSYYAFLTFLAFFLGAAQCSPTNDALSAYLEVLWVHSHEDDQQNPQITRAFRKEGYDFPPSRGRESFKLLPDNSLIWNKIAPTDGFQAIEGTWKWNAEKQSIEVSLNYPDQPENLSIQIVSYQDGVLQLAINAQE
jgi:hypothetical protein